MIARSGRRARLGADGAATDGADPGRDRPRRPPPRPPRGRGCTPETQHGASFRHSRSALCGTPNSVTRSGSPPSRRQRPLPTHGLCRNARLLAGAANPAMRHRLGTAPARRCPEEMGAYTGAATRHTGGTAVTQFQRVFCVLERIGGAGRGQRSLRMQIHPRERPTRWEPQETGRRQPPATLGRERPRQKRRDETAPTWRGDIGACEAIGSILLRLHDEDGIGWPPDHLGAVHVEDVEEDIGCDQEQRKTEDAPPPRRPARLCIGQPHSHSPWSTSTEC